MYLEIYAINQQRESLPWQIEICDLKLSLLYTQHCVQNFSFVTCTLGGHPYIDEVTQF